MSLGTNIIVGRDTDKLRLEALRVLLRGGKRGTIPPLWDGHAAERIAAVITLGASVSETPAKVKGNLTRLSRLSAE